jgi:hypothetical protein
MRQQCNMANQQGKSTRPQYCIRLKVDVHFSQATPAPHSFSPGHQRQRQRWRAPQTLCAMMFLAAAAFVNMAGDTRAEFLTCHANGHAALPQLHAGGQAGLCAPAPYQPVPYAFAPCLVMVPSPSLCRTRFTLAQRNGLHPLQQGWPAAAVDAGACTCISVPALHMIH